MAEVVTLDAAMMGRWTRPRLAFKRGPGRTRAPKRPRGEGNKARSSYRKNRNATNTPGGVGRALYEISSRCIRFRHLVATISLLDYIFQQVRLDSPLHS